jgi:site-specific recombinase XerD
MKDNFSEVLEGFLAHAKAKNYAPTTLGIYRVRLGEFFDFLREQGIGEIKRVGRETLKAYQLHVFQDKRQDGKPYSHSTGALKIRALKRFFEWLESSQQILFNPADKLPEPKREYRIPRNVLTEEQMANLLEQPDLTDPWGIRDKAIMELFYSTGLRLGELVKLTLLDVDLQGGVVRVNQGKGAKDRVVPMGETAVRFLKEYLTKVRPPLSQRYNGDRLLVPGRCPSDRLFLGRAGRPFKGIMIQRRIHDYALKAGLTGQVSPHTFRHSFATHLVKQGADIQAVARMLGHKHLRVTQMYTRVAGVDVKKTHGEAHPREKDELADAEAVPQITRMREPYRYADL